MKPMTIVFKVSAVVLAFFWGFAVRADDGGLPERPGPRPLTTTSVPHVQINVAPARKVMAKLLLRVKSISGVEVRSTVVSLRVHWGFG